NVEDQLGEFALSGAQGDVMSTFDDAGGRGVELGDFSVENGFLFAHVAAAGFPGDPGFGRGGEDENRDGVGGALVPCPVSTGRGGRFTFDGDGLRGGDFDVVVCDGESQLVHQTVLKREVEAGFDVVCGDAEFV